MIQIQPDLADRGVRLSDVKPGCSAEVLHIDERSGLFRRLGDLGIRSGTRLYVERISLFGDPAAYRVIPEDGARRHTGTVIALRREDAQALTVRLISDAGRELRPASVKAEKRKKVGAAWD
ncbi:MAG: ferrous iron transport protein A [Clostridia bacterium]|nr:ferrous iron transport protein A [Clostridia bacterium]